MSISAVTVDSPQAAPLGTRRPLRAGERRALSLLVVGGAVVVGAASSLGIVAGLAAVVAVCVGLLVLSRPLLGALCLVAVAPTLSGVRRGLPVPGFRISELAIAGIAATILLAARPQDRARWRTFDWLALAYVAATAVIGALDIAMRGAPFTGHGVGTLLGPLQFLLLYRAAAVTLTTPGRRRRALRWMVLASVPVSTLAILQQLDVLGVRALISSLTGVDLNADWTYQQLNRATGPFPHWHMLGGYLMVVIVIAVALLLDGNRRVLPKRVLLPILALDLAALFETVTIAPVLAVVAAALLFAYWAGKIRRVVIWMVVAAASAAILFAPTIQNRYDQQFHENVAAQKNPLVPATISYRYGVWTKQYIPALSGRWVLGYGSDLPPSVEWKYTESLYIALLLRGGLVLLAIYGGLMWALAAAANALRFDADRERATVARVVLALVVVLVPLHFVMPYFVDTGLPHLLWGLAGVMLAGRGRRDAQRPARGAA